MSRLIKTRQKDAQKDLVKYIALTIGVIAFLALVGFPLIIPKITGFIDQTTGRGSFLSNDATPPPPPQLDSLPRYTKEDSLEVNGRTESGVDVFVVINGHERETIADQSGQFSIKIDLDAGDNEVYAYSKDEAGNTSDDSKKFTITQDKTEPTLEVIKPTDGAIFFGQEKNVTIEGQTESGSSVKINGRIAIVGKDGKFDMQVGLSQGGNTFEVVAIDQAGNEKKLSLSISYSP